MLKKNLWIKFFNEENEKKKKMARLTRSNQIFNSSPSFYFEKSFWGWHMTPQSEHIPAQILILKKIYLTKSTLKTSFLNRWETEYTLIFQKMEVSMQPVFILKRVVCSETRQHKILAQISFMWKFGCAKFTLKYTFLYTILMKS